MYAKAFQRPRSFYGQFERKPGDHLTTHYCPGCGHGNIHKMIAEAIDDLGAQDRTVFISPVGCSVFAYYYFDVGNLQVAHGRAPAVATAVKRALPDSLVISYQGDGDLGAIGGNEILQAANRGEDFTVIFINNAIYGADRFRNPAIVLADGFIGQMMEPVEFPLATAPAPPKPWAAHGDAETRHNLITSIYMSPDELEQHVLGLEAKYATANPGKEMYEQYRTEDAQVVVIGYGIVSRLLRAAVDQARARGLKVGLFRPITLWPFPAREIAVLAQWVETFLTVELSNGQMVEDVRLAVNGERPVRFYSRVGGMVPTAEELLAQIIKASEEKDVRESLSKTQEFLWAV